MILEPKRSKQGVRGTEEIGVNPSILGRTSRGPFAHFQSLAFLFAGKVAKSSKDFKGGLHSPRLGRGERKCGGSSFQK